MTENVQGRASVSPQHDPVATATYHAPEGENKVVEWQGVTFMDGVATPIYDADLGRKIKGNKFFEYTTEGEAPATEAGALAARRAEEQRQEQQRREAAAKAHEHDHDDKNKRR